MVEADFERRLERMFSEAPSFPDAESFTARVEGRLDRGWTARRWLIGVAGLVGGVIGASQLVMANVLDRVESAEDQARALTSSLSRMAPQGEWMSIVSTGGMGMWVATVLAVLTMGFVLTRVIEEI